MFCWRKLKKILHKSRSVHNNNCNRMFLLYSSLILCCRCSTIAKGIFKRLTTSTRRFVLINVFSGVPQIDEAPYGEHRFGNPHFAAVLGGVIAGPRTQIHFDATAIHLSQLYTKLSDSRRPPRHQTRLRPSDSRKTHCLFEFYSNSLRIIINTGGRTVFN